MRWIKEEWAEILKIEEELTILTIEEFKNETLQLLQSKSANLVLDLTGVRYMNSSSLGILAHTVMNARKRKKELVVAGINKHLFEIFEIVKFSTFMTLFSSLEEAQDYFTRTKK